MDKIRMYDVYVINDKTQYTRKVNKTPMTHKEACTFKSNVDMHRPNIRFILKEV